MVLVPRHVAESHNLRPRNVRLAGLEVRRNTAGGFGNNLDPALNAMSKKPVRAEVVGGLASRRPLDAFDRFANGIKRRPNKPLRQKTRSAEASIWSLSSGSKLSRVRQIDLNAKAAFQELLDADQFDEVGAAAAIVIDEKIQVALQTRIAARG